MNICIKCRESLLGNEKDCKSCMKKQNRFFKRKGVVVTLALAIMLLLVVVATHVYMKNKFSPSQVVAEFKEAVLAEDYESLAQMMNEGQDKLRVSKEEAKRYALFLREELDFSDELINRLINSNDVIEDQNGNKLFTLVKSEKNLFFYSQYEIRFYPMELLVSSQYQGTEIFLDKEKLITLSDANTMVRVAYVFPGLHVLKTRYQNDYTKLMSEEKIDFTKASNNQVKIFPKIEGTEVSIHTNDPDAMLFVNGNNSGMKISEIKKLGPLPMDGSIVLHGERINGGMIEKTEPATIVGPEVKLMFGTASMQSPLSEKQDVAKDELERFMMKYYSTTVEAINARDFSIIAPFIDPEGKAYVAVQQNIERMDKRDITEELLSIEMINYALLSEGYSVTTKETYNLIYEDRTVEQKTFQTQYYLVRDKVGLKIHTLIETVEI